MDDGRVYASIVPLHALQPEQLIAKLPPEYYVVLPEVIDRMAMRQSITQCLLAPGHLRLPG